MATAILTRKQIRNNPFRMKTHEEILDDLAYSRSEYAKGHFMEAGAAAKEIRARYDNI